MNWSHQRKCFQFCQPRMLISLYVKWKVFEKCKLHSRPFTSVEEIEEIESFLKTMNDNRKQMQMLYTEL